MAALLASTAHAADDDSGQAQSAADPRAFKLTFGLYRYSGSDYALDTNLRHTSSVGNVWLGHYESGARNEHQSRAGWDRSFELGPVRLLPSLQTAEGGFWGGSLYAESGEPWFVGLGYGRTNLRPYINLNFDPNDAYSLAFGKRWSDGRTASALFVRDNREHPDQRHLHITYRAPLAGRERVTLDLLYKKGLVDGDKIERWGFSAGYDWPRVFVRLSWDPKANFGKDDLLRLSFGARF